MKILYKKIFFLYLFLLPFILNAQNKGEILNIYTTNNSNLQSNYVQGIAIAQNGGKWLATNNGLHLFNEATNEWTIYSVQNNEIPDNQVRSVAIRRTQNDVDAELLIGTFTAGLGIKTDTGWFFINKQSTNNDLYSNYIKKISTPQNSDTVWLATAAGLSVCNWVTGNCTSYKSAPPNVLLENAAAVILDNTQQVWCGSINGGLVTLQNNELQAFTLLNSEIHDNTITAIAVDSNNIKWLGGAYGGLCKFNSNTQIFETFTTQNSDLAGNSITALQYYKPLHLLFVGTETNGVSVYNIGNNTWQAINNQYFSDFPYNTEIKSLAVENDSILWIGTTAGLIKFKYKVPFIEVGLPNTLHATVVNTVLYPSIILGNEVHIRKSEANFLNYNLYSITGELIERGKITNNTIFFTKKISSGMYIVQLINALDNGITVAKIFKN